MSTNTRAVVIGAGIDGLVMARVLGEVVDRVEVLERGRVSDPGARLVPMQRRIPVLLSGHDLTRLERWFPDLADDLTRRGAVHTEPDGDGLAVARPVLLDELRRRTLAAGIELIDEHRVDGISVDVRHVAGVYSAGRFHRADLVVDSAGQLSLPHRRLWSGGWLCYPTHAVFAEVAVSTAVLNREPGDPDVGYARLAPSAATGFRGGCLLALDEHRWQLSVGGMFHEPTRTPDEFARFTASLPQPWRSLADGRTITGLSTRRYLGSQLRRPDLAEQIPGGLLFAGRTLAGFHPLHPGEGPGLADQASALAKAVQRQRAPLAVQRVFHRTLVADLIAAWRANAAADLAHPCTEHRGASGSTPATSAVEELRALREEARPGRLVGREQVVGAVEQHQFAVRNGGGEFDGLRHRHPQIAAGVHDQRGAAQPRRESGDIDVGEDLQKPHGILGTRRPTEKIYELRSLRIGSGGQKL